MLPDSRASASISPAGARGGRSVRSPLPKSLFKTQAIGTIVPQQSATALEPSSRRTRTDIFVCDEESHFYSQCLEKLLVKNSSSNQTVIEFGSGDGSPVIGCLMQSQFSGIIHGFELNKKAAALAHSKTIETHIHNSCFFQGMRDIPAGCLIANPPYIPAPDNNILMPALHGGEDGANMTRDLMTLGFDSAILLISSYANPVETLQHATKHGYQVTDFMVTPMPFGYYSSEPKVKNWIWKMRGEGKAFCSDSWYLLAGVLFQKRQHSLPQKRKAHIVGTGNGHVSNDSLSALAGDEHSNGAQGEAGNGDCFALRHRYATTADGDTNAVEDQMNELMKVMTALC
ncbi:MAG: hypothetical protein FRX49_09965 [Trebouxia sp. A1-2]|nr:MAG: hypothetical protein FRX49_09965 [Trebouxia sp. A1-2]